MTDPARESAPPPVRGGTAVCLSLGLLLLSALPRSTLLLIPLGLLLVTAATQHRWRWIAVGTLSGLLGFVLAMGTFVDLGRAWALLVGGAFALVTVWRPGWGVFSRAIFAIALSGGVTAAALAVNGQGRAMDALVRGEVAGMAAAMKEASGDAPWAADVARLAEQAVGPYADLYPAHVALQSLVALGLATWLAGRFLRRQQGALAVRPWRDFRFNDQFVWLLIGGIVLMMLPLGAAADRIGLNAVVFMAGLYLARGIGVLLYFFSGASSVMMVVLGALAAILLYPFSLMAAALIGLGDTWLDMRSLARS